MAKIVYLRTDKNGTKYYANYTCPRCGGAGGSDKWAFTGWTCYECGGTGESSTPVIEKEYTPEYRAKLDERARKRAEAKRAKQVEEFNNNRLAIAEKYGFNPEGKIYVVTGNTYEIPSYAGWGTDAVGINVFRDDAGNCFIWKSTSAFFNIAEGSQVRLRGTVKEHSDYKGTKQTILQRCKVDAVKL